MEFSAESCVLRIVWLPVRYNEDRLEMERQLTLNKSSASEMKYGNVPALKLAINDKKKIKKHKVSNINKFKR